MTAQDSQSFLSMTYASALVQVKRNFDKFMQLQLQSIEEAKIPKRSKCGLVCYVENFGEFATLTESIFRKSERRTDLDKWYVRLVDAIFQGINQLSMEHPKTPSQVVKMENYHHMHDIMARLKVAALENMKKEAKLRYNEALRSYVTKYFGRPLEKLNVRNLDFRLKSFNCSRVSAILRRRSDESLPRDQRVGDQLSNGVLKAGAPQGDRSISRPRSEERTGKSLQKGRETLVRRGKPASSGLASDAGGIPGTI